MCFHSKQTADAQTLKNRFKAKLKSPDLMVQSDNYNGFEHPKTPVITNEDPGIIQTFHWGLLPPWARDTTMQKNTLNARIETIREKPAFQPVLHQKCLILLTGFYEWKHLDAKTKEKYVVGINDNEPFAVAGLWSRWRNPRTTELMETYTIITTEARGIMREIHNTKYRMPVILQKENEEAWLMGKSTAKLEWENIQGLKL